MQWGLPYWEPLSRLQIVITLAQFLGAHHPKVTSLHPSLVEIQMTYL